MSIDDILRMAYGANILILVPVVGVLLATGSPALIFGVGVTELPALRLLVASLVLTAPSAPGLNAPRAFVGVLVLQVIYKSAWLLIYVLPTWRRVRRALGFRIDLRADRSDLAGHHRAGISKACRMSRSH